MDEPHPVGLAPRRSLMRSPAGRLACSVALAVAGCLLLAGPAPAASIKGAVVYAGPAPDKKLIPINIDQYVCGKSREGDELVLGLNRGIRWAVVSLQSLPPGTRWEPSSKPVQMDQQACVYVPRVVTVPVGGTVVFLNCYPLHHNLHCFSIQRSFFHPTEQNWMTASG